MFDKWRRYSYAAQKHQRYRLLKILFCFLALYVLYNLMISWGFSVWSVENDTMQSDLQPGDKLIFASYTFPGMVTGVKSNNLPFKRGDIVLVDISQSNKGGAAVKVLDGVVRFFTAQRYSVFDKNRPVFVKRIIGLPGDEISMNNYIFRVKTAYETFSLTEFEMAEKPYHPLIPRVPGIWDESIPFSGTFESITLGADECFVVSDDRSNTNDSRTWGPVSPDMIRAQAVFRFWPLKRMGRP